MVPPELQRVKREGKRRKEAERKKIVKFVVELV
jgi:hypothetical protein